MSTESNDPRKPDTLKDFIQTIPEPTEDNTLEVLNALKEAVETLGKLRGEKALRSVTFQDLQDLNLIDILVNDTIESKLPFGKPNAQSLGMLKFCDGYKEDFGQGMGWYYMGNGGEWMYLSNIIAVPPTTPPP